ncbi:MULTISPECIES: RNA polymerase sigma factor [Pseudomonas]|jgi:RNA polymerase sigma factor (sigma-70 family)|uniref:RNA polymerase sigma factor n=1 Tax=Pseudomonas TaxID=286 RepID=UPI0018E8E4E1|nr:MULTISPECIES: RNA polymerase sigma factor [Pseudomonas]MBJ2347123.1 RNA polymerase sigma factor [Pseudomonas canavaninivorans]MBL3542492.1 RNA polymerase sigma factor [Pseudomonas sp. HB05]
MTEKEQSAMLKVFLASYDVFRARLRRRLGSDDLANDVLHETYLRVDRMEPPADVQKPGAYLFRMALNIAADRRAQDARLLTGTEIEELMQTADEHQDPAVIVGGQIEIRALMQALTELAPRRRQILMASRMEQTPHQEIAQRFGISTRMVEKELKAALQYCADRLERKVIQRFGPGAGKQS